MRRTIANAGLAGILASCVADGGLKREMSPSEIQRMQEEAERTIVNPSGVYSFSADTDTSNNLVRVEVPAGFDLSRVVFNFRSYSDFGLKNSDGSETRVYDFRVPVSFLKLDEGEYPLKLYLLREGYGFLVERNFLIDRTPPVVEVVSSKKDRRGKFIYDIKLSDNLPGNVKFRVEDEETILSKHDTEIPAGSGGVVFGNYSVLVRVVSDAELMSYTATDKAGNPRRDFFDF